MEHRVKILAVDDRPENLLALEGILATSQYELVCMRSGEEALRYLLREDIRDLAVILMDVQMPGLNGFETVELIKQREYCSEIPIIFLTAISKSMEHVLQGYHVGSIDYLFKPIHPELLKMKVDAFVKLHSYHQRMLMQSETLHKRTLELEETNRKLEHADLALKHHNEQLELIVATRTRELTVTNERLRKSQERFEKMFMSSPCLISIRRLSDQQYIDVNESWKKYTGYNEEALGQSSNLLQAVVAPVGGEQQHQVMRNVKLKYVTKANEVRSGLLSTEIIDVDDEKCLLEVIIDVTENVQYEQEMTRLAQLNLIGEMAAGIAHEIRNPMTTIRGFLQFSQSNGGKMEKEYIDIMVDELDRANGIITEYLSLAKNKKSDMQPRQINAIVESLYPLIQAEAMMTDKHVHVEFGDCPSLLLDEKEIRQLILNISINGLEAMQAGGGLSITTYLERGCAVLQIADRGNGISEEHLEKLGRPFFTTKEHGTGLGLAICYSIAARHNAVIEVQSSEQGTTFYIRFACKSKD